MKRFLGHITANYAHIANRSLEYGVFSGCHEVFRTVHTGSSKQRITLVEAAQRHFPQAEPASEDDRLCIQERQHFGPVSRDILVNKQRCRHGFPQAMVLYPVSAEGKVSSGPLRLTCPHLVKAIDEYEAAGGIDEFNQELQSNPALQDDFHRTNARWKSARYDMMDEKDLAYVNSSLREGAETFLESGIIGVAPHKIGDVKCLHAHLADYLVRGENVIGERVKAKLEESGVAVSGSMECWQQCNRACDVKQAGWWYVPTKNKFKFMRRRLRKTNPSDVEFKEQTKSSMSQLQ